MISFTSCDGCAKAQQNYDKLKATYCVLKQKIVYIDELMRLYLQKCAENDSLGNQLSELRTKLLSSEKVSPKPSRRSKQAQEVRSSNDLDGLMTAQPRSQQSEEIRESINFERLGEMKSKLLEFERTNRELRNHIYSLENLLESRRSRSVATDSTQTDFAETSSTSREATTIDQTTLRTLRDQLMSTVGTLNNCLASQREGTRTPRASTMVDVFKDDVYMCNLSPLRATPPRRSSFSLRNNPKRVQITTARNKEGNWVRSALGNKSRCDKSGVVVYTVGNTSVRIGTRKRSGPLDATLQREPVCVRMARPMKMARVSRILSDAIGSQVDLDEFLLLGVDQLEPLHEGNEKVMEQEQQNTECNANDTDSEPAALVVDTEAPAPNAENESQSKLQVHTANPITNSESRTDELNGTQTCNRVTPTTVQNSDLASIVSPLSASKEKSSKTQPTKKKTMAQKRRERAQQRRETWKQFETIPEPDSVAQPDATLHPVRRSAVSASAVDLCRKFVKLLESRTGAVTDQAGVSTRSADRASRTDNGNGNKNSKATADSPSKRLKRAVDLDLAASGENRRLPEAKWFSDLATVSDDVLSGALRLAVARVSLRTPSSSLYSLLFIKTKCGLKHRVAHCSQQPMLTTQETYVMELLGSIPRSNCVSKTHADASLVLTGKFRAALLTSISAQCAKNDEERCSMVRLYIALCRREHDLQSARALASRIIHPNADATPSVSATLVTAGENQPTDQSQPRPAATPEVPRFIYLILSLMCTWPAMLDKRVADDQTDAGSHPAATESSEMRNKLSVANVEALVCVIRLRLLSALAIATSAVDCDLRTKANCERLVRCYELLMMFCNTSSSRLYSRSQLDVAASLKSLDDDFVALCQMLKSVTECSAFSEDNVAQNDMRSCKQMLNIFSTSDRPVSQQAARDYLD